MINELYILDGNRIVAVRRQTKKLYIDSVGAQHIRSPRNVFASSCEAEDGLRKKNNDKRSRMLQEFNQSQRAVEMFDTYIADHWNELQDGAAMLGLNPMAIFGL